MLIFEEFLRCYERIIHSRYRSYAFLASSLSLKHTQVYTVVLAVLLGIPIQTNAAVIISEIAWMGTVDSANDEWIELHNTGSTTVSIDGWTLTDSMNLQISLAGSIGAGSYVVLERTDETSAPGTALLIYTGALSNTGSTLTLKRSDGAIEDQVAGGENWEGIGGDNTTKHTPQYSGSEWVTGPSTPGAKNTTVSIEAEPKAEEANEPEEPNDGSGGGKERTQKKETVTLILSDPELSLSFELPSIAYVNQPLTFAVKPDGISDRLLASVGMVWNFGDAHTATGREVMHAYAYPGEYVVSIHGSFARHEALARHTITVLPVTLSLTLTSAGDVRLHNDARYELDLSGYVLYGRTSFTFPEHTFLLPYATLTIPTSIIGASKTPVLFDQQGVVAAYHERIDGTAAKPQGVVLGIRSVPQTKATGGVASAKDVDFAFASEEAGEAPEPSETILLDQVASKTVPGHAWPYLGLMGAIAVSMTALVFGRRHIPSREHSN